jgi:glycosyltransferase involved in cell wall biosynthesis
MDRAGDSKHLELSVVVPLLNEEGNIPALYREITDALAGRFDYEVIFVDDGSTDGSYALLADIHKADARVRVIRFRRNFGQTAAMSAGFDHARGQIVIPMDADRQNDPADIPKLIGKLREGYDVVSGWRKDRQDRAATRRLPSVIANKLIAKTTGVALHDFGCTLKAYRKEVLDEMRLYGEMHRFIPALANWKGARICEMVVNHRARTAGESKYGLGRTMKVVLDLITVRFLGSYSTKPIYMFGGLGLLCGLAAVLTGMVVLYQKFLSAGHLPMNRNPLLTLTALLVTTAVQFVLMGLLAEILVRTYHESQGRPIYVIKEVLGPAETAGEEHEQGRPESRRPQDRQGEA